MIPSLDSDLLFAVAEARLGTGRTRGTRLILGCVLKAVLFTIAVHENEPITVRAIADRCSCNEATAACAVHWLKRLQIVEARDSERVRANIYSINRERLAALEAGGPLVKDIPANRRGRAAAPVAEPLPKEPFPCLERIPLDVLA